MPRITDEMNGELAALLLRRPTFTYVRSVADGRQSISASTVTDMTFPTKQIDDFENLDTPAFNVATGTYTHPTVLGTQTMSFAAGFDLGGTNLSDTELIIDIVLNGTRLCRQQYGFEGAVITCGATHVAVPADAVVKARAFTTNARELGRTDFNTFFSGWVE